MIDFSTVNALRGVGFVGFESVETLRKCRTSIVPEAPGVYCVLTEPGRPPRFLNVSSGGYFKGKDPTVATSILEKRWVPDAIVLNIGKAGGPQIRATLRSRIRQYLDFGEGKPIGHRGGRYIWQIEGSERLIFCWMPTPESIPREVEKRLIRAFTEFYGKPPFANLNA